MIKVIPLLLAGLLLTGCAELAARGVSYGTEAIDAAKDYVDEKTDRREALRKKLYELEDQYLACLSANSMVQIEGGMDCTRAQQAVKEASAYIDTIYPDLAKLIDEIDKIKQAIARLRAN